MDRLSLAGRYLEIASRGLELGPSHNPTVRKSDGYPVEILDHATQAELRSKYVEHGLDQDSLDAIEEVDYIWSGGSMLDAIPETGVFHWIIAAHFIEHTVDIVGFLADCTELLVDGGSVLLIVPDKRYTFDRFRPLTSLGDALDQSHRSTRFHPVGAMVDESANAVWTNGALTAVPGTTGVVTTRSETLESVLRAEAAALAQTEYHDVHRWIFTPKSLGLLVEDLAELGRHGLRVEAIETFDSYEFVVVLRKSAQPFVRSQRRVEAMLAIEDELLGSDVNMLRAELEAMRTSISWRVTAPLRSAHTLVRRMFRTR